MFPCKQQSPLSPQRIKARNHNLLPPVSSLQLWESTHIPFSNHLFSGKTFTSFPNIDKNQRKKSNHKIPQSKNFYVKSNLENKVKELNTNSILHTDYYHRKITIWNQTLLVTSQGCFEHLLNYALWLGLQCNKILPKLPESVLFYFGFSISNQSRRLKNNSSQSKGTFKNWNCWATSFL